MCVYRYWYVFWVFRAYFFSFYRVDGILRCTCCTVLFLVSFVVCLFRA